MTPANGATGIGPNGQVVITFSKSMNPATLTSMTDRAGYYNNVALLANGSRLSFSPSVSADNRTVTLSNLGLPASTVITVIVTHAVTGPFGERAGGLTRASSRRRRASTPAMPSVVNQRPGNGATGSAGEHGQRGAVREQGDERGDGAGGAARLAERAVGERDGERVDNGQTIEFTPTAALQYGALVQVFLDTTAQDTDGNAVYSYQGSFTMVGEPGDDGAGGGERQSWIRRSSVPLNTVVEMVQRAAGRRRR